MRFSSDHNVQLLQMEQLEILPSLIAENLGKILVCVDVGVERVELVVVLRFLCSLLVSQIDSHL